MEANPKFIPDNSIFLKTQTPKIYTRHDPVPKPNPDLFGTQIHQGGCASQTPLGLFEAALFLLQTRFCKNGHGALGIVRLQQMFAVCPPRPNTVLGICINNHMPNSSVKLQKAIIWKHPTEALETNWPPNDDQATIGEKQLDKSGKLYDL